MKGIQKMNKTKSKKKHVILLSMMLVYIMLATGCSRSEGRSEDVSTVGAIENQNVVIDWECVNTALDAYDFPSNGYYLSSSYQEEQQELNIVTVTNYDNDQPDGFKQVAYQLLIVYGECSELNAVGAESKTYEEAMIEISLFANDGSGDYAVIYNADGETVETYGEWFLTEHQEAYLQKILQDAREMFGLKE